MASKVKIGVGVSALMLLSVLMPAVITTAEPADPKHSKFRQQSQLIIDNDGALIADTNGHVKLVQDKLVKKDLKQDDVDFLAQLAGFSNDVVEASKTGATQGGSGPKLSKYPKVQEYLKRADDFSKSGESMNIAKSGIQNPITGFAIVGNPISEALGMSDCGFFGNAKPNVGKSWVTYNVSSAESTLKSWGYNATPGYAGGGWTRAQTWHSWNCGWHTFRDHALINTKTQLKEQNYHGWSPRGEPNPVVHSSGPWPYAAWPTYVYWWHSTR